MDISIIVLNYNTKKLTADCINSIYNSKPKINYEVILVDNNSADGSVELFKEKFSKKNNFSLIENTENSGFSKGNNIGIKKAKGRYILLLNSDTIVKNQSIDNLYRFARENENVGVVGAKLLNKDGTTQPSVFRSPTMLRVIKQYWLGERKLLDKYAPGLVSAVSVDAVVGAAFLITPDAIKKVGLLNEKYFMYFEDLDYCRQVRKQGLKVYYLPTSEIIHLHGQSGKKFADNANQWKRLVPSAKMYYGEVGYYVRWFIMRTGQAMGISK